MMARHDMKGCRMNRGVALISALIVVSVAAGIFAAIMYYAMTGSELSGLQRKYQSSKEASLGAIDILTKDILPRVMSGTELSAAVTGMVIPSVLPAIQADAGKDACFRAKLSGVTSTWPGGTCDSSPDATVNSDIVFNLKSTSAATKPFVVSMKIVDTVTGNSDRTGTILETASGVVDDASSIIKIQHFPFLYTIMTDARPQNSTTERANIEVLYAY
ncbi:MAG: hypothetical protein A4E60_01786 [Syntrophorhabdus sp. PtaB.Bin047]|nr:MAG: hypothetical protein A4E60_01786 [Syntrophorhabdus sp. PtaB.Bin047]